MFFKLSAYKEQLHRAAEEPASSSELGTEGADISGGRNMNKASRWQLTGVIFLFDFIFQKSNVR